MSQWTKAQKSHFYSAFKQPEARKARALAIRGKHQLELERALGDLVQKAEDPVGMLLRIAAPERVPDFAAHAMRELGEEFARRLNDKDSSFFADLAAYLQPQSTARNSDITRTWHLFAEYRKSAGDIPSREELLKLMEASLHTNTIRHRNRILMTLGLQNLPTAAPKKVRGKDKESRDVIVRRPPRIKG